MLTGLRDADGSRVVASATDASQGPFRCWNCHRNLILNKGRVRIHHFRHRPAELCSRSRGESETHLRCKADIARGLAATPGVERAAVEIRLGPCVADVFALIHGRPVAIEIQRSVLSVNDIQSRTAAYARLGVHVLWLALPNTLPLTPRYSPKAWERWLHAAYRGRVYYWHGGLGVHPIHFGPFVQAVPPRTWYEKGGLERSTDGHERFSRRYRSPVPGPVLDLVHDFSCRRLPAFSAGTVEVPTRTVYMDKRARWWSD